MSFLILPQRSWNVPITDQCHSLSWDKEESETWTVFYDHGFSIDISGDDVCIREYIAGATYWYGDCSPEDANQRFYAEFSSDESKHYLYSNTDVDIENVGIRIYKGNVKWRYRETEFSRLSMIGNRFEYYIASMRHPPFIWHLPIYLRPLPKGTTKIRYSHYYFPFNSDFSEVESFLSSDGLYVYPVDDRPYLTGFSIETADCRPEPRIQDSYPSYSSEQETTTDPEPTPDVDNRLSCGRDFHDPLFPLGDHKGFISPGDIDKIKMLVMYFEYIGNEKCDIIIDAGCDTIGDTIDVYPIIDGYVDMPIRLWRKICKDWCPNNRDSQTSQCR